MTDGQVGQQGTYDATTDFSVLAFIIKQALGKARTAIPVQVLAVHGGGVGPAPTVDVQPIINQIDGQGNATAHGKIFNVPVARIQGGKNAIIIDPQVNDIGLMVVSDRDISSAKANNGKVSNPGSYRRHNLADGTYVGAILMPGTPNQYIIINTAGVKVVDAHGNIIQTTSSGISLTDVNSNSLVMGASGIDLNGVIIDRSGNVTTPGGVTAGSGGGDSVTLQHHVHTGNGIPPTPGT